MGILFVPQTVLGKCKNKWKKTKNQKTPQTNKEIKRGNFLLLQKSLRESHYSHSTAWKKIITRDPNVSGREICNSSSLNPLERIVKSRVPEAGEMMVQRMCFAEILAVRHVGKSKEEARQNIPVLQPLQKESVKLIWHEVQVASLLYIFLEPGPEISPRWIPNLLTLSTDCRDCFQRCQPPWTFSFVMLWVSSCQSEKIY